MEKNNFQLPNFPLKRVWKNEEYVSARIAEIRKYLESKNVNINTPDYKNKVNYIRIRNEPVGGFPGGPMSLEEFIERFLSTEYTFESIYDMGNPYEIKGEECTDTAIATEICRVLSLDKEGTTATDVCKELQRKKGLIERIKKYLGIDLNEELNRNDDREKRERSKILYFFYMLEHRLYPNINVLMLLSKPSMESIDNTYLGWQTHNGKILRTVKESLGKELTLEKKSHIRSGVADISTKWDNILDNARLLLDFLYDYGFDYNSVEPFQSPVHPFVGSDENHPEDTYQYPVERLYLIISKSEYLGNLFDIEFVNKIPCNNNYDVPPELVEEMKSLWRIPVNLGNAKKHIRDNARRLSRYVYLGRKATKEDVRRIRTFAHKFKKFLNFCYRAKWAMDIQEISNELQIVSLLQAVILDNQNERFDYTYHNYQDMRKHMMRVLAALKNDKPVPDALQIYWVRKVTNRWYANVGKYNVLLKIREIEQACDEIRKQILSQPTLEEMIAAHDFYLDQIEPGLFDVRSQIEAVSCVLKHLQKEGFRYVDQGCNIRYVFLDSEDCDYICNLILVTIQNAIRNHAPSCQVKCVVQGTTVRESGFFLELAFDYREKTCKLARFYPVFE